MKKVIANFYYYEDGLAYNDYMEIKEENLSKIGELLNDWNESGGEVGWQEYLEDNGIVLDAVEVIEFEV